MSLKRKYDAGVDDLDESDSDNYDTRVQVTDRLAASNLKLKSAQVEKCSTFADLGISKSLQAALASMSINKPTQVQAACIPPLLTGRDCIGNAKTGSGKTMAFALPILQRLSLDPYGIFALVLTPTRSLESCHSI